MVAIGERSATERMPERTRVQRMAALETANEIRSKRALLKKQLKRREINVQDVLLDPPEWAGTMKVIDLLLAAPKYGRVKANKALVRARISPSKTLGGMSARQRAEIASMVRR
jgi:hypothetical protein